MYLVCVKRSRHLEKRVTLSKVLRTCIHIYIYYIYVYMHMKVFTCAGRAVRFVFVIVVRV